MITVGRWSFPSSAAAERHIREMFWRYAPVGFKGFFSRALEGDDLEFALALIEMHRSRDLIIDSGIVSIHIQPVPWREHDQRRFAVYRKAAPHWHDFSWRNALSPESAAHKLADVLRHLIREQTWDFAQIHFRGVCQACHEQIDKCHVDHAYPATFAALVKGWLGSVHLTADDIAIVSQTGYQQYSYLEDPALARSWIEYHEINARLRCVCKDCNLSRLRSRLTC